MHTAINPELIERHIRNAHRIRSEAVMGGFGKLAHRLRFGLRAGAVSFAALFLIG